MPKHLLMSVVLLMVVWSLSVPTVGSGQGTSLIYACVDAQGRPCIVPPGTSCGARETLLTWPATPAEPATFYQRASGSQPVVDGAFTTVVAFCDDPADTATGGEYRVDGLQPVDQYGVATSVGCRASGLCAGPTGADGWTVVATSRRSGGASPCTPMSEAVSV
jgi:hypothetical protein